MNDITALAQQLRATAEKANEHGEFNMAMHTVQVLALVEALEKAQRCERRWHQVATRVHEQACDSDVKIEELESRTVTVKLPEPHAHLIWIQAGHAPDDYWDDVAVSHSENDRCCDGSERYPVYAKWEIEEMLAGAGIQVIEGEG